MGLFSKLFGRNSNKSEPCKCEEKVENLVQEPKFVQPTAPQNTKITEEFLANSNVPLGAEISPYVYNTGDEYFANLITEQNFPGYTIEKAVHPSVFNPDAHPKCFPITYLFKKDGVPALAVFIMNGNQYRAMIALGSYRILDENNIKYIRFFRGLQNEESYVLNRIKENLIP